MGKVHWKWVHPDPWRPSPEKPKPEVTNIKFSETNEEFISACAEAGVEPTQRQASKYRNKKGKAFLNKKGE